MKATQILLDMDGVLVNFIKGALKTHKINLPVEEFYKNDLGSWHINVIMRKYIKNFNDAKFWHPFEEEWWANLEPHEDYEDILDLLEDRYGQDNITIVTSHSQNIGCVPGKIRWLDTHMDKYYSKPSSQAFMPKKWLAGNPNHILIDDHETNCDSFVRELGNACLVPRISNRLYADRNNVIESMTSQLDIIDERIRNDLRVA